MWSAIEKQKSTPVFIHDTTLRDGEQMPGVNFLASQKRTIIDKLVECGVDDIEVGVAPRVQLEPAFFKSLVSGNHGHIFSVWCRANIKDVEAAAKAGFGRIHISVPVSDFQLKHLGYSRQWVRKQICDCVEFASRHIPFVSIGAQDATRADPGFLKQFARLATTLGVHRLRFSDTVGICTPPAIFELTTLLRKRFPGTLEFHGHNDLGLAVANSLSAVAAGADAISVTVNGIGERAGNAALEQTVAALEMGMGRQTNIQLPNIPELCHAVSDASGIPIPVNNPISGKSVFTHESGIHYQGQLKNERMFQPFDAAAVGRTGNRLVIGQQSGSASVQHALQTMGIQASRESAKRLLPLIRSFATSTDGAVNSHQLRRLWQQL